MRKFIQNKLKNQKGLTLIELLAVIVILAIIAAIAIPAIGNIISNSRHNAVKADFQNVLSASNLYFTEKGSIDAAKFTNDGASATPAADINNYVQDLGKITKFTVTKASGGNTISGVAVSNGVTYTLTTAVTNAQLGAMDVAGFKTATGVQ